MRRHISWRTRGAVMTLAWHRPVSAYLCAYCFHRMDKSEVVIDHVMPVALGGTNDAENLQVTCWRCKAWKSDKTPEDAEEYIYDLLEAEWEACK